MRKLSSIMVYFRLNQSMQVCAPRRGRKRRQKAAGLFFCNNNAGVPPLSLSPDNAKHATVRCSMPLQRIVPEPHKNRFAQLTESFSRRSFARCLNVFRQGRIDFAGSAARM
ncbi:hypothetical protein GB928_024910 [Shinella curvata]|uniref:Uncharacterized protein n=1 Tax=Shinella curvata TaxID=1817964 RepID=A0ABT8XL56_9HYPH|nr:hypothetical protein [Shinella curvata]MCJ8056562.1 hypothetical protein [Shinella curvata]MDO6124440.1 hypothetical protein [Shinella curvata]